jgi:hypothetical protein
MLTKKQTHQVSIFTSQYGNSTFGLLNAGASLLEGPVVIRKNKVSGKNTSNAKSIRRVLIEDKELNEIRFTDK